MSLSGPWSSGVAFDPIVTLGILLFAIAIALLCVRFTSSSSFSLFRNQHLSSQELQQLQQQQQQGNHYHHNHEIDSIPDSISPSGFTKMEERPTRAFVIVRHGKKGYLLLRAYKKRKGTHFQLPGGRIDEEDASPAAAAARELFEETGLDFRSAERVGRLEPLLFPDGMLTHRKRQYFSLFLDDKEFPSGEVPLRLSKEHTGAVWEMDTLKAAELVSKHSGGSSSFALLQLMAHV